MNESTLEQSIAHRILHTASKLERFVNQLHFEPMGLTLSSATILFLVEKGFTSPFQIQQLLDVTKSNITQRLNVLEKKGLIIRRKEQDADQRKIQIQLTPLGNTKLQEIHTILSSRALELERMLEPTERTAIIDILTKIDAVLCATVPCPCSISHTL